jgi:hypothetical protein
LLWLEPKRIHFLKTGDEVMPYRHAHYYLVLLVMLTVPAFWPTYFSVISDANVALHIHSFTASLWIALLLFQSWAIHHRHREWHHVVGVTSLALFPLFLAGSVLIAHKMALEFSTGDLFNSRFGARFAALDLVAVLAIAFLFWSGLRWRRKVHQHSGYMLGTVFFLLEPIFARLLIQYVPGLAPMPPEFARLTLDVDLSLAAAVLFALALAWKHPKSVQPWIIIAGLLFLQLVLFSTLGVLTPWEALLRAFAEVPAPLLFSCSLAVGAFVSWRGWNSIPRRPVRPLQTAGAVEI